MLCAAMALVAVNHYACYTLVMVNGNANDCAGLTSYDFLHQLLAMIFYTSF